MIPWWVFYVGLPLSFGLIIATVRGSPTSDWPRSYALFFCILSGFASWWLCALGGSVMASFLGRKSRRLIPVLVLGCIIATPFVILISQYIIQAMLILVPELIAVTEPSPISDPRLSVRLSAIFSLHSLTGMVMWVFWGVFFYSIVRWPILGFDPQLVDASEPRTIEHERNTKPRSAFHSPLFARLPSDLGTNILAITAEEHYIHVYTDQGSTLILYRLSDAAHELGNLGMLVHRRHWVAHKAVLRSTKKGQSHFLTLLNGLQIPVSRSYQHEVREVGLLR